MKKHENIRTGNKVEIIRFEIFVSEKNEAHRKEVPLRVTNGVDNHDRIGLIPVIY